MYYTALCFWNASLTGWSHSILMTQNLQILLYSTHTHLMPYFVAPEELREGQCQAHVAHNGDGNRNARSPRREHQRSMRLREGCRVNPTATAVSATINGCVGHADCVLRCGSPARIAMIYDTSCNI